MASGGEWFDLQVAGHQCQVFEPAVPNPLEVALLFLHDDPARPLRAYPQLMQPIADQGLRVIAPLAGKTWWTDRVLPPFDAELTAEQFVVNHIVPLCEQRWKITPPRIGLVGVQMGGQGALRIAMRRPTLFPVVAGICPAIDYYRLHAAGDPWLGQMYETAEAARQDSATLHVHPLNWPRQMFFCCDPASQWFDGSDILRMKLGSSGIMYEADLTTTTDGDLPSYLAKLAPRVIAFLLDRLAAETRRV